MILKTPQAAAGKWYHGTLTTTGWADQGDYSTQTIVCEGMNTNLVLSPVYCEGSDSLETNATRQEELNKIVTAIFKTLENSVMVSCSNDKIPTCDLNLYWWGVKE